MKTLSLLQPWATVLATGHKQIETRSWNTRYRGTVLIHASKTRMGANELMMYQKWEQQFGPLPTITPDQYGAIIGKGVIYDTDGAHRMRSISAKELAFGDYSQGRYMWFFKDLKLFKEPIPCKGSLGLWEYSGRLTI